MSQKRRIDLRKLKELIEQDLSQLEIATYFGVSQSAVSSALKRAGFRSIKSRIKQGIAMKISKKIFQEVVQIEQKEKDLIHAFVQMMCDARAVMEAVKGEIDKGKSSDQSVERLDKAQDLVVKRINSYLKYQETINDMFAYHELVLVLGEIYPTLKYDDRVRFQEILAKHNLPHLSKETIRHDREDVNQSNEIPKSDANGTVAPPLAAEAPANSQKQLA